MRKKVYTKATKLWKLEIVIGKSDEYHLKRGLMMAHFRFRYVSI